MIRSLISRFGAQPTPRGKGMMVLLAIMFLFAIATGEVVVYRMAYFLTVVIVGSYVCAQLKLWGLEMRMQNKPHVVRVGDTLKGHVYVRNRSLLPIGCVEILQISDMPGDMSGVVTAIGGRGEDDLRTATFCHARGVYTIGPLLARTSDPLGLFRVQTIQGNRVKVVVQPPVVALPYFRLPVAEGSGEEGARYRSQTRTPHVATIREYIHGDSLNRIHWLSTAKRGQLMSKEFDSGGGVDVWVVVDLNRKTHHSQGTERTDEYAVAIAASLANVALSEEHSVGLIAHGDQEYLLPLKGGTQQMSRVLETLVICKTEGRSPLAEVLVRNASYFERSASLLVVTSSTATEWTSVLRKLRYRSFNIAVVLVDSASFGGEQPLDEVVIQLVTAGIPTYVVRRGDHISYALSRPITPDHLPGLRQYNEADAVLASSKR